MTHALNIVWNPSEGIDLGFFIIRYYSLMFVIAFGLGWYIMKNIFEREGESIEKLDSLFIWTVLATLIGARLGHVFFYDWEYYRNHLMEIILPFRFSPNFEFTGYQGLASHGAAISIIIAMYFYSKNILKRPQLWILDRVVIPVASGAIFVRLGNFFNSEIVGKETTSAFGIRFIRDKFSPRDAVNATQIANPNEAYHAIATDPKFAVLLEQVPAKHPTQLYEAFCYIFVFAILFFLYWKTEARLKSGYLFGMFLVLLFSVRIVVESVKESQGGFENELGLLSTGQWLSIPFILIGLYFIFTAEKPVKVEH
ncbi:prolipoprotein diacylglyceryl transferase [Flavobacterium gawalongense]|uniref:Phosphatidylglycerol--prolipoprotein diacylglyceryl transferase n=1 Tax=Flavobacterium gawalongense TaxID=2594432 RepID=A0A553BQU6_9FLAO|nr:prolipoprotein diacylglyceryl transferase [Flavobacterium gawalongense]TRX00968.1 prolipoprotein diacylglyceryl transferase [Flavobacterium gawalongense]TRX05493.1 prolipoprotein diacylglyceryl transferase [Flavobacterium gawalongense]TRX10643.1 prolipoprotein diacylglyceryl transferase [Flavobacterium gawalongense]TRX11792.1 prolipoprotein diacylglyceryl transferase [Flavobacterium gawalongense]TRX29584.1 prolipoprotein diacylglyceryl transferase [Flavobacterium gawalongense]